MDRHAQYQDQDSVTVDDEEITKADPDSDTDSDTEVAVPDYWQSGIFRNNNQLMLHKIEEGTSGYVDVNRSFFNGMRNFEKHIDIVGIHKKNYEWSVMDEARMEAFRVFTAAVASRNGGDPNIKYGWYGGSREQIREILCYGFSRSDNKLSSHGHGVCFSPVNNPAASARMSIADSDGVYHILLCRLILGKPEQIPFGSKIDRPTSPEFNSGVDDISSPTKYIIWEAYMNTFVLPVFIVTFKADLLKTRGKSLRMPRNPYLTMNVIMNHLPKYLSSSKMAFINKQHEAYYRNKIPKHAFIKSLRTIAGDDILRQIMKC